MGLSRSGGAGSGSLSFVGGGSIAIRAFYHAARYGCDQRRDRCVLIGEGAILPLSIIDKRGLYSAIPRHSSTGARCEPQLVDHRFPHGARQ